MGYEVTVPLKVGTLEIEFDTVAELERRLRSLDVRRIERAVLGALREKPRRRGGSKRRTRR